MAARRADARPIAHSTVGRSIWGLALALALAGCIAPSSDDATNSTIEVEREGRERGDREAEVGESVEVYGITATVVEVGRVAAYNDLDDSGYIWARVVVENTTNREVEFHRRHFKLEKPDGTASNTANISTESQIGGGGATTRSDALAPGDRRQGQVIYTVGDIEGQFALLYAPPSPTPDSPDRQRGAWVFESSPDDAE